MISQCNSRRLHGAEPSCPRLRRTHQATPQTPASDRSSPQGCQAPVLHTGCPDFASDFRLPALPSPHSDSQAVTLPGPHSVHRKHQGLLKSTSCEMPGWMKHMVESRLLGEISITSDMQMTPTLMAESEEELKGLLMKVKEDSEKDGLKFNIQKMKIMASSSISSWQRDGETMETVRGFIILGSKITVDGDCSHEIKRRLLLERKATTKLDNVLKSRDITLPKVHMVTMMVFPVGMYRCESWNIKKAERRRIDTSEPWCWRRLLRVPWTARRSNQFILKETNPEYSLEGLMLKLQYFGHLI
ncbi:uncharacterized protein LOC133071811 [Dama dama]|uniref:uncharacterized protein LOC133071811 n=1 Tax=Dama dama TaxID=30532 RepID=UPI002A359500|nr:uncharacterized protein LOC133071811 [Dama dama]